MSTSVTENLLLDHALLLIQQVLHVSLINFNGYVILCGRSGLTGISITQLVD